MFDIEKRFVTVRGRRSNGLVEFDFAVGDPDVFVEMVLTEEAFEEFCQENHVEILEATEKPEEEKSDFDWRISDAVNIRFKDS